jgi:hypothetical protein
MTKTASSGGSVLITVIIAITLVAILGAGLIYFTTTSTFTELFGNRQARAYYLAEAGGRWAQKLLAENIANPSFYPGGKKNVNPPTTFTLANGDRFILTSYDFIDKDGNVDLTRVVVESTGVVHAGTWMEAKRKITFGGTTGISRTSPTPSQDTEEFVEYIKDNVVFVYGNTMDFDGDNINGPGATMVIRGPLNTNQINSGAFIAATTIYIDGYVKIASGGVTLGSQSEPGSIYINGDLELAGGHKLYGNVYVNGNLKLQNCNIYGNIYVNGNTLLSGSQNLQGNIYYTGTLTHPQWYGDSILAKCHKIPYGSVQSFPSFTIPEYNIPAPREASWFASKGYVSSGTLVSNIKIFTEGNYESPKSFTSAKNVIIVSKSNITITKWFTELTGLLYAPNGKVTIKGENFTGMVIARDGFFTEGGTNVTFQKLGQLISDPADYPFKPDEVIIQY